MKTNQHDHCSEIQQAMLDRSPRAACDQNHDRPVRRAAEPRTPFRQRAPRGTGFEPLPLLSPSAWQDFPRRAS